MSWRQRLIQQEDAELKLAALRRALHGIGCSVFQDEVTIPPGKFEEAMRIMREHSTGQIPLPYRNQER